MKSQAPEGLGRKCLWQPPACSCLTAHRAGSRALRLQGADISTSPCHCAHGCVLWLHWLLRDESRHAGVQELGGGARGRLRLRSGLEGGSAFRTKTLVQERPLSRPNVTGAESPEEKQPPRPLDTALLGPASSPGSQAGRPGAGFLLLTCSSALRHVAVKCPPARVRPPETLACPKALQEGLGLCNAVKATPASFVSKGAKKPHLLAGLTQASASWSSWGLSPGTGAVGRPSPQPCEKGEGGT